MNTPLKYVACTPVFCPLTGVVFGLKLATALVKLATAMIGLYLALRRL